LYIGGDGLARGYLHQPEQTAERFIHDAVLGRLYRSGDLVSWNREGELQFHGRNDNQIKLRGFRIELEEIETALQTLPTVAQALVLCQGDETGDKQLVGYVVANEDEAKGGSGIDGSTLRQQLNTILPPYMVPSWIMVMESLPINPNGKVDRNALPKPGQARSGQVSTLGFTNNDPVDEHFRLDPLGALVLEVWSEVLGCTVFGADDNFFELGGHSLAAAHVVARLEKRLPTKLSPADLFRYPTPRLLTERLRESEDKDPNNPIVTLKEGSEGQPLFVIHGMFGDVFGFVDFARCMPEEQKIYGVQMPRAQVGSKTATVESLASLYGEWIRKIQPEGPYHLMAGSAGGWFAYAVAADLQRANLGARRLILLDTLANPILGKTQRLRMLSAYGRQCLTPALSGSIAGGSILNDLHYILGPRWRRQGIVERLGPLVRPWVVNHNTDYSLALVRRYRPPRLSLDLDLLTPLPTRHWSLSFWPSVVTGEIRIHKQFSRHADFFAREHAQALATTVQALLDDKEPQPA
jgi:enterobactin synthetase component F